MLSLTKPQKTLLLTTAWQSIAHGLKNGHPLAVQLSNYPPALLEPQACFVTLSYQSQIRGCIGSLTSIRPFVQDVSENAFAAAFCDRHYEAIQEHELADLQITLDCLSAPEPLSINSEQELIRQLNVDVDGLTLQDGSRHATFLPSMWKKTPNPMQFVQQLKHKAGLPAAYWAKSIKVNRFKTQIIANAE